MSVKQRLPERFAQSVADFARNPAVVDPSTGDQLTYAELDLASDKMATALVAAGVQEGDRIGLCLPKSVHAVVALLGVLKAGAAYVPVDAGSPPQRNAFIFADCAVRCVIAAEASVPALMEHGDYVQDAQLEGGHTLLVQTLKENPEPSPDLAYVLYTSGSTGSPKGVMLTHGNALSFVDWCIREFQPTPEDRFSSHAPFHFDLSILDLYVPLLNGASIVILNEALGKNPAALAECIESQGITCWYSTPSILRLLVELGKLDQRDLSSLRLINFAGEVFPIKYLRALKEIAPHPAYYNLYGPTETNVCTFYRIPDTIPADRTEPYPIGYCCDNDRARVVDTEGCDVATGEEGELVIQGGTVMLGYWNLPQRTDEAYFGTINDTGGQWYRTGDVVRELIDVPGCYLYSGRRDRMIKRRGYRVELGEIEAAYHRYPAMREAAAIAVPDEAEGMIVRVFLVWDSNEGKAPSTIRLKAYAAKNLPPYMIPDRFVYLDALPQTSTDKTDYQKLAEL
ncbi:MAG: amino acid adenylation domain-containing protein [Verrucomicrobiales bacterium]